MSVLDWCLLVAITTIWLILVVNVVLVIAGYLEYLQQVKRPVPALPQVPPFVSVMVPAHNEGIVIVKTVEALLRFDYPQDRYEIIVINDNSDDDSAVLLAALQRQHPDRQLTIVNTDAANGGRGKSNALNIGLAAAQGEVLAIYDADNTPEAGALRILVSELMADDSLGAVIGKFRTRNRHATLLTRFINIETLSFQWMAQAGRQHLFGLCTIPGTNYVIRRELIDAIGGWDVQALAEDTEISFHVYLHHLRILFQPKAVTWEQEPQTLPVWFHQRTRWVKGNIYVILKNLPLLAKPSARIIHFDLLYYLAIYFLLMASLVLSDVVFVFSVAGVVHSHLQGFSNTLWLLAIILFVVSTYTTITTEKGERNFNNVWIIILMYVTYSQLWLAVAVYGMGEYIREQVFHKQARWYKTKRFE
ncbi:glycosyltransferase family 2 protein [Schleiferilactobacillus harbinensis]|jgi:cellulose synthase/poly-beta-1,6-N-acetylglucosamine synthase-like glycosyltransferase|uniref:glycosyltransferase family 2 protein n=1 Tax=Schleiferilactobacillus harbinensis TaxID=304207 RepID=UPI00123BD3E3|nr:glycosyltransferase [Schleiferilactobacillus harbinensis]MCI1686702.1 glycosyltransferase [Schleiferilactobacillus harbinensis]MCI1784427.1 glycosyltransferase [Schleiferilactobacillus harbinensis]MCI1849336.1 glycosyltransferase [Schleiferilactobacillus harbinensis]QEU48060.1 glycosyltransferase family 2 protein [Schleiferilactobacillus harbinensis]